MGTPTSIEEPLRFKVADLLSSHEPEEKAQAERCNRLLIDTVAMLEPVLKYIVTKEYSCPDGPWGCRLAEVAEFWTSGKVYTMFIGPKGEVGYAVKLDSRGHVSDDLTTARPYFWHNAPFGDIIAGLTRLLQEAQKKREAHLEAIKTRTDALVAMSAIINNRGMVD